MNRDDHGSAGSVAGPQATASGLVLVERHMFRFSDPEGASSPRPPTPTEEQPVTFGSGHELIFFHSASEDGRPHVGIELWASQPPDPEGDWDFSTAERLTVGGRQQSLVSGVSCLPSDHRISIPDGEYVVGVWCRGRKEARALVEAWEAEEYEEAEEVEEDGEEQEDAASVVEIGTGVERWLLRFWPAD